MVLLAGVLLAALTIRLLYLAEAARKPDFRHPAIDADYHDYWARCVASGNWTPPSGLPDPHIADRPYIRPPGYPYFLAGVYRVTGPGYLAPRLVQLCIGVINCLLVFLLARRWFDASTALIACAFASSYWVFVYYEMEFLEPVLLVGLGLLLIYALSLLAERPRWQLALGAGMLLGLFALVRPNVLLFGPVAVGWEFWLGLRHGRLRSYAIVAAAFTVGAIVAITPATVRNYIVGHDVVLISANAGVNLLIGNNSSADGMFTDRNLGAAPFASCYDYPSVVRALEEKLGRSLRYSEASAYFARQAYLFAREHPAQFLRLTLKKAALFWCPFEMGHNKEEHYERLASPVLRRLPGSIAFFLAGSIVGVAAFLAARWTSGSLPLGNEKEAQRFEVVVLMILFAGTYYVSFIPFFVAGQYRVPVVPFLQILAACGVWQIIQWFRSGQMHRASLWVLGGAILYLAASVNVTGYRPSLSKWYFDTALACAKDGRLDQAVRGFNYALKYKPDYAEVHYNVGLVLAQQGRMEEALAQFRAAEKTKPDYTEARFNSGVALTQLGRTDQAIAAFRSALAANPEFAEADWYLAKLLAQQQRYREAIPFLERAAGLRPDSVAVLQDLTNTLLADGKTAEAVSRLHEFLARHPNEPLPLNHLAWVRATCSRAEYRQATEAIILADRACRLTKSEVPSILDTLAAAYAEGGRFEEAGTTAQRAMGLARAAGETNLAAQIESRSSLYRARRPYHETGPE